MSSSSPPAAYTHGWRGCNSRPDVSLPCTGTDGGCFGAWHRRHQRSRPPAHLVDGRARAPIEGFAGDDEALLFIKANGARIVLVDVQIEAGGRYPLGFGNERRGDAQSPRFRRDHGLIDVEGAVIDGHKAEHSSAAFRHRDRCRRHELIAPALAPPVDAVVEIDLGIGELPGAPPQFDRLSLVVGRIAAKREGRADHRVRWNMLARLGHALGLTAPSASARCGGCGQRPPRSCRYRSAETRRSPLRPAVAAIRSW